MNNLVKTNKKLLSDKIISILIIIPSILAIAVFVYGFIIWTAYASFSNWNTLTPNYEFNGFNNYINLFSNDRFLIGIRNTISFTIIFLAACIIIGLVLALILDSGIRFSKTFSSIFLFPMCISFIVTGCVWRWILNPSTGINLIMKSLGFEQITPKWYTDPSVIHFKAESGLGLFFSNIGLGFLTSEKLGVSVAIFSLIIAAIWQYSGYTMAMFLAALRGIPEEYREASLVDGASALEHIRYITLPLLKPIVLSAIIILGHVSLKIFDLVSAMTGPGPGFATDFPAYFMFDTTFRGNHFAEGSAVAIILLVSVALLIVPYITWMYGKEADSK